jgi:UDPglucose--hexose-1-phosphate uridylyltransferase
MPPIRFEKRTVTARIRHPMKNFQVTEEEIEVRTDPLLGYTSRILSSKGLDAQPEDDPLPDFAEASSPCFFCEGRVETQTPMLPEDIHRPGRIQVGKALLFPNLAGYGKYSGVCILSKDHFLPIESFHVELIVDALRACQEYFQRCAQADEETLYPSVNWNYLLPAGSSLLHSHLQPILDPIPTNAHRDIIDAAHVYQEIAGTRYWQDFRETERNGPRFLFESNGGFWFTPFAPVGFNEYNALVGRGEPFLDLDARILEEMAEGLHRVFRFYHQMKHNSFNLVLFSPPVGCESSDSMPCFLKVASRPVFAPYYRNDVTFFERFHQESIIDRSPEELAEAFRDFLKHQK